MNARNVARWLAIAGFGGFGVYLLVDGIFQITARGNAHGPAFWFLFLPLLLIFSGLFVAIAYLVFRRNYARLWNLAVTLTALLLYGLSNSLLERLGINMPWSAIGGLASAVLTFYGAHWACRRGRAFISRSAHASGRLDETRWD